MTKTITLTARGILLDIEGTTSSISFVHDVMFPYVRQHLVEFLETNFGREDVVAVCDQIAKDAGKESLQAWAMDGAVPATRQQLIVNEVNRLMDGDVKATGLKALQGLIWAGGFHGGSLRSHVYPEVIPQIRAWRNDNFDVRIYSSGSIAAQKLFFGHVDQYGDCLEFFSGHYDTTIGSKRESSSYQRIADDWGLPPSEIVFVSDIAAEIEAAAKAGVQVVCSVRPGNPELPNDFSFPCVTAFDAINLVHPR
jgi:enolase-phosphatase E1